MAIRYLNIGGWYAVYADNMTASRSEIGFFESSLAQAFENWKLLLAILLIISPPATFAVTSILWYLGSKDNRIGREPPLNPYWIPLLGSWISFPLQKQSWFQLVQ